MNEWHYNQEEAGKGPRLNKTWSIQRENKKKMIKRKPNLISILTDELFQIKLSRNWINRFESLNGHKKLTFQHMRVDKTIIECS